jgi:hypothetical protein
VLALEVAPSVFDAAAAPSDLPEAVSDLSDPDVELDEVEDFSASMAFLRDSEG